MKDIKRAAETILAWLRADHYTLTEQNEVLGLCQVALSMIAEPEGD